MTPSPPRSPLVAAANPPKRLLLMVLSPRDVRPPLPPFTSATATLKARLAEDAWNSRDPEQVALAYTPDTRWRYRNEFLSGRIEIVSFLTRKWERELDYRLVKEVWTFTGHRISVRFVYEWPRQTGGTEATATYSGNSMTAA